MFGEPNGTSPFVPHTTMELPLSPEQLEQFERLGYVVLEGVLSAEDAEWYRRTILDLVPRDLTIPPRWRIAAGRMKPYFAEGDDGGCWDDPAGLRLLCHETLYRAAVQLLGTRRLRAGDGRYRDGTLGITLRNDTGPARSQALHVDASIPFNAPRPLLTPEEVQVGGCYYFNDVGPGAGGIHVVPGGHHLVAERVRSHPSGWQAVRDHGFFDDFPESVEVTAQAGDFVLLHHLVPHGASNNRSPAPRVAQFTRFLREDNPHYPGKPSTLQYCGRQLEAMGDLGRRLLGLTPW